MEIMKAQVFVMAILACQLQLVSSVRNGNISMPTSIGMRPVTLLVLTMIMLMCHSHLFFSPYIMDS